MPANHLVSRWVVSLNKLYNPIKRVDIPGPTAEHWDNTAETIRWHTGILQQACMILSPERRDREAEIVVYDISVYSVDSRADLAERTFCSICLPIPTVLSLMSLGLTLGRAIRTAVRSSSLTRKCLRCTTPNLRTRQTMPQQC